MANKIEENNEHSLDQEEVYFDLDDGGSIQQLGLNLRELRGIYQVEDVEEQSESPVEDFDSRRFLGLDSESKIVQRDADEKEQLESILMRHQSTVEDIESQLNEQRREFRSEFTDITERVEYLQERYEQLENSTTELEQDYNDKLRENLELIDELVEKIEEGEKEREEIKEIIYQYLFKPLGLGIGVISLTLGLIYIFEGSITAIPSFFAAFLALGAYWGIKNGQY